jgi:phage baseplate assembly protein W
VAGDDFLGTGWAFPPEFSQRLASTRMVAGIEDIRESLYILLSTIPGERVMVPSYGCDLHRFVFRELSGSLIAEVRDAVTTAIIRWESRIQLLDCLVTTDTARPGLLLIELSYKIRGTNGRGNMVYPFYLIEATLAREA